jgi:hypothetical protein
MKAPTEVRQAATKAADGDTPLSKQQEVVLFAFGMNLFSCSANSMLNATNTLHP